MQEMEQNSKQAGPPGQEYPGRIIVEFKSKDGLPFPYQDHAETKLDGEWMERWYGLTKKYDFPDVTINRAFPSVDPRKIRRMVARALRMDPTYVPEAFLSIYMIDLPPGVDPQPLAEELNTWEIVDYAYVAPYPAPPPYGPTGGNPQLSRQDYLRPPVFRLSLNGKDYFGGIDVQYVWGSYANQMNAGNGVAFIDIEKGWNLNHLEFAGRTIPLYGCNKEEKQHGTNVLGILYAQDNSLGGVGIAYKANASVVSGWVSDTLLLWHDAILKAGTLLSLGDVLLLEVQSYSSGLLLPVEIDPVVLAAIRLLTALGITVVESAGNGNSSLDSQATPLGKRIFDPGSIDYRDSGAILVGAADPGGVPASRLRGSNFGSRVDCFAAGDLVSTTDTDASGTNNSLPDRPNFSGTSAAAAIVAGAALVLQGIAKQPRPTGLGFRLNAFQIRNILSDTTVGLNTRSRDPAADRIGVMPNLQHILRSLNGVYNREPDLLVRDSLQDDGRPRAGTIACSPDIIIRPANSLSASQFQAALGGGNPNRENEDLSIPVTNQPQDIFVRVINRGGSAATRAQATVYWSPPATLVTPALWNLVGTSAPLAAPVGLSPLWMTVLNRIPWIAGSGFPGSGNYCYVAVVGCAEDANPLPDPHQLTNLVFDDYLDLVRSNNNIAWRNRNTVSMSSFFGNQPLVLVFHAPGAYDAVRSMQLRVGSTLPAGATLYLEDANGFVVSMTDAQSLGAVNGNRLSLLPSATKTLRTVPFPAGSLNMMQLGVYVPPAQRTGSYEVYVQHLYKGSEAGRITWKFVP